MKPIRSVADSADALKRKLLYLTFDDGPDNFSTASVLDLLDRQQVRATFFVISEKVQQHSQLFERIKSTGHAVGNHSLDHRYSAFFKGKRALKNWIEQSESILKASLGEKTIGFRPPAGVQTPELYTVVRELGMPLVLWQTRFFDTTFTWTQRRALRSLKTARSGDIILLHDRQSLARLPKFLETLEAYILAAKSAGFEFDILTRQLLAKETHA
jgi:peptidoglycan/xylan/chitin deacetylase (PgdA/CDA1 family)